MKNIIRDIKALSINGVLAIYLTDRKIRLISSSNVVASLQRVQHELLGNERIKVVHSNIPNKKLRSLITYIHKKRLEALGYQVRCGIRRWGLDSRLEDVGGQYRWILKAKNTYSEMVLGVFITSAEMHGFLKKYYPGHRISAVIISSNEETKNWYEIYETR